MVQLRPLRLGAEKALQHALECKASERDAQPVTRVQASQDSLGVSIGRDDAVQGERQC